MSIDPKFVELSDALRKYFYKKNVWRTIGGLIPPTLFGLYSDGAFVLPTVPNRSICSLVKIGDRAHSTEKATQLFRFMTNRFILLLFCKKQTRRQADKHLFINSSYYCCAECA